MENKMNGVQDKTPIFWFKKRLNDGRLVWLYVPNINEEDRQRILDGRVGDRTSPLFWYFLKYKDNGIEKYYPIQLLYRSPAERYLNSVIVGERDITEDEYQHFVDMVEDYVGGPVDWYYRHFVNDFTKEELDEHVEQLMTDANTGDAEKPRIKAKMRLLSVFLALRDHGAKSLNRYVELNGMALAMAQEIHRDLKLPDETIPTDEDLQ